MPQWPRVGVRDLMVLIIDVVSMLVAFWMVFYARSASYADLPTHLILSYSSIVAFVSAAVFTASAWHRQSWRYILSGTVRGALAVSGLITGGIFVGIFLIDRLVHVPRSMIPIFFAVAVVGLVLPRVLYSRLRPSSARVRRDRVPVPALLVGGGPLTAVLVEHLTHPQAGSGLYPVGILDEDIPVGRRIGSVPVLGRTDDLRQVVHLLRLRGEGPRHLLLTSAATAFEADVRERFERTARSLGLAVHYAGPFLAGEAPAPDRDGFAPLGSAVSPWLLWRGPIDRLTAALLLAVAAPVLAVAAVLLVVGPGLPLIFVQVRPGRDLVPFRLFKLRTLRDPMARSGPADMGVRLSPTGRLVRSLRVDELPQLWNVVRGEMALIGPRPLVLRDLEEMPEQGRGRFLVRPGITGWAQVNGGNELRADEKYALDLWYIAHASPAVDLEILWRTLTMVARGERRNEPAIAQALAWYHARTAVPAAADLSAEVAA